jgi:hypothetical protein
MSWRGNYETSPAVAVARALLRSGLTLHDIASVLRAHPRAVIALLADWNVPKSGFGAAFGRPFSRLRSMEHIAMTIFSVALVAYEALGIERSGTIDLS